MTTDSRPPAGRPAEPPPEIEGYRIIENLGHGGTSSVWKAEQVSLNRPVVIKILSESLSRDKADIDAFQSEARIAAALKHPGIVQVYDFGLARAGRRYYFVMEYISGYSVGDWIRRKGKISEPEALLVVHGVADALKFAWAQSRVVHCDIKPDNIMVDGDGSVKVTDLGLARPFRTSVQSHADSDDAMVTGTPNYMAPEQIRGDAPLDCRTDIYALGASLHHMVTGQLPFGDSPPAVVLERRLKESLDYPQKVNPDLSTAVTRLIVKMTAADPAARHPAWDDVLADVIRIEHRFRHPEESARPARAESAPNKTERIQAPAGPVCRHCGRAMPPQAAFCGSCGNPAAAGPGKAPRPPKDRKLALAASRPAAKPKAAAPPASAPPPAARPEPPAAPAPARWRALLRRHLTTLGGNLRMLLSLGILAFIGYYVYQKTANDYDILPPLRARLKMAVQTAVRSSSRQSEKTVQWFSETSHRLIWSRFQKTPPAPQPAQEPASEPAAIPPASRSALPADSWADKAPAETPEPEDDSESPADPENAENAAVPETGSADASESGPVSDPSGVLEIVEPESPEPAAPAPAAAEPPAAPEPEAAPDPAAAARAAYAQALEQFRGKLPRVGDRIALRFKDQREPIEGILAGTTPAGVQVTVPAGTLEYPFRLLNDDTRLLFFPEEQARRLHPAGAPTGD